MKTITFKINNDYIKAEPVFNDNMKGFKEVEALKGYLVKLNNIEHYARFILLERDGQYYLYSKLINKAETVYSILYKLSYDFQEQIDIYSFMGYLTKFIDNYLSLYLFHKAGYKVVKCNDTIKQVA